MPYLTRSLVGNGAVVELLVGVNEARRQVLERNSLRVPDRIRLPVQIDTGSAFSAVDLRLLERLDIQPIDRVEVRTPTATEQPHLLPQYAVGIALAADDVEMFLTSVEVVGCAFGPEEGIQGRLGRDVLERCLLVYDGKNKTFSLAF